MAWLRLAEPLRARDQGACCAGATRHAWDALGSEPRLFCLVSRPGLLSGTWIRSATAIGSRPASLERNSWQGFVLGSVLLPLNLKFEVMNWLARWQRLSMAHRFARAACASADPTGPACLDWGIPPTTEARDDLHPIAAVLDRRRCAIDPFEHQRGFRFGMGQGRSLSRA